MRHHFKLKLEEILRLRILVLEWLLALTPDFLDANQQFGFDWLRVICGEVSDNEKQLLLCIFIGELEL